MTHMPSLENAVLPDVLEEKLRVVFCGAAVGTKSAERGAYYAGPGNKFWPTLHRIGLTPRCLEPSEYRTVTQYGIGLTDLVKVKAGPDTSLRADHFDTAGFEAKIRRYRPRLLCFNGKKAAQVYLRTRGVKRVDYGLQQPRIGDTRLFVAPSTSGAANGFWDERWWREVGEMCGAQESTCR